MRTRPVLVAVLAVLAVSLLSAVTAAQSAPQGMTPRPLERAVAVYGPVAGAVREAVELSDRRVLLNDPGRRLLLVTDSMLRSPRVVLDSAGGKDNSYGPDIAPVYSFRGDSLLFSDRRARTFLVLDTALRTARTIAGPYDALLWPMDGFDRWSAALGLVHYTMFQRSGVCDQILATEQQCPGYVAAMHPDTHVIDTLGRFYLPDTRPVFGATSDHVAVTTDGSIAILRSREYRIDWINVDRSLTNGPRIPYPWVHLDEAGRKRIADSLDAIATADYNSNMELWRGDSTDVAAGRLLKPSPRLVLGAAGGGGTAGRGGTGGADPNINAGRGITATRATDATGSYVSLPRRPTPTNPARLPDYIPPVTEADNELLADRDNRLWIHAGAYITAADGPIIYDIVDRTGALVDRVQLPVGRSIIGFGKGGVVYLVSRDGGQSIVEKARLLQRR